MKGQTKMKNTLKIVALLLLILLMAQVSYHYVTKPRTITSIVTVGKVVEAEAAEVAEAETSFNFSDEDVLWLAKNIYFEARNQSIDGKLAVLFVTLNRVEDRRWPNNIKSVVTQNNPRGCQFSWYCDKNSNTPKDKKTYREIKELVIATLSSLDDIEDVTRGAVFYHATYVNPYWAKHMQRIVKIGDHIFYK